MKKIIIYALSLLFLILSCPLNIFAQDDEGAKPAAAPQTAEEKKAAAAAAEAAAEQEAKMREYGERKADLELQLSKLSRDKKIASQDGNKALEDKRTAEIRDTRRQLKDLDKEYGIDSGDKDDASKAAEAKKKSDPNLDMNALNRELAREIAKMEGGSDSGDVNNDETPAPAPKKPAKKSKQIIKSEE